MLVRLTCTLQLPEGIEPPASEIEDEPGAAVTVPQVEVRPFGEATAIPPGSDSVNAALESANGLLLLNVIVAAVESVARTLDGLTVSATAGRAAMSMPKTAVVSLCTCRLAMTFPAPSLG